LRGAFAFFRGEPRLTIAPERGKSIWPLATGTLTADRS
jgi:hypothetical protein